METPLPLLTTLKNVAYVSGEFRPLFLLIKDQSYLTSVEHKNKMLSSEER